MAIYESEKRLLVEEAARLGMTKSELIKSLIARFPATK
ncbi:MAG: CopG family transcriptional regulator [Symploca sp. SIO2D2]|nr:CopG family transcriptional regulator [Symploca sp. SIO2D2]